MRRMKDLEEENRRLRVRAALLGINQPKVSALKNFKLDGFSVERLMSYLTALGSDIEIRIKSPKRVASKAGRIVVATA